MADDYVLYRWFDISDRVLYIGKSGNLGTRSSAHIKRSQWMQFAVRSTVERRDTPQALRQAERTAIESEHPIFNRQYNDTPEAKQRLAAYLEEIGRTDLLPGKKKLARLPRDPVRLAGGVSCEAVGLYCMREEPGGCWGVNKGQVCLLVMRRQILARRYAGLPVARPRSPGIVITPE